MPSGSPRCTGGQNGSRSLRTVPYRESQVQGAGSQGTQKLGRESTEMVRGTQEEVAEHRQSPLHALRRRTRTLL